MLHDILHKLVDRQDLTRNEASDVMTALITGQATPGQIGALLVALRMKGETVAEVTGFVEAMRAQVVPVPTKQTSLLDTCGTGGSKCRVFNVSTSAAFALASLGVPIAKHGNRAMSGICGSADVLEACGIRVNLSPDQCARCIDEVGIGFLFAPGHHPALKHVGPIRREIGVRSVFNLLGPLCNPAGATRQTLGVYDHRLCPLAIGALRDLGSERAIAMHGEIGLDEIATTGITYISELRNGEITHYTLDCETLGLRGSEPCPEDLAPRSTPEANADLLRDVLAGKDNTRAEHSRQELAAVNIAASLRVCDLAETWPEAVELARETLRSGKALAKLEELRAFTQVF